jgi:hypothetical protein
MSLQFDPEVTKTWTNDQLLSAIEAELKRMNSSDDPLYWFRAIRAHPVTTADWNYWVDRLDKGDGVGKGYKGDVDLPPSMKAPSVTESPQGTSMAAQVARMVYNHPAWGQLDEIPTGQQDNDGNDTFLASGTGEAIRQASANMAGAVVDWAFIIAGTATKAERRPASDGELTMLETMLAEAARGPDTSQ